MGFNSTVMILNDTIWRINDNAEEWAKSVVDAILSFQPYEPGSRDHFLRNEGLYQTKVAAMHHADSTSIVLTGGNTSRLLGYAHGISNHPDHNVDILKQVADQLGYRLVKKTTKRKSK